MTAITKARFMDGLVLWLPMAEGAGSVVNDQSKYGNNGVFGAGAAAPSWVAGRDGLPSVSFDGNDTVSLTSALDDINTSEGTVIFWLKPSIDLWEDGNLYNIFDVRTDGSNNIVIYKSGDDIIRLKYEAGGANKYIDTDIADNWGIEYHQLAMSWSIAADKLRTYADGSFIGELDTLGTWVGALIAGSIGIIWLGLIDGLRIYNRALDPYEIKAYYEAARKI